MAGELVLNPDGTVAAPSGAVSYQTSPTGLATLDGQPYTAPDWLNGGDGGQVQGTQTTEPAPDPYAQWGGQSSYNNLVSGFDTQKQNIYGTSNDAANNAAVSRHSGILDFLDSLRGGQRTVDERGVQNELGKKQGFNSIMDMVGQGIRSGGVMLANKNAGDSSAAEGIARAYGKIGQRELGKVGNQYENENRQIGLAQSDLNQQRSTGLRKFDEGKVQTVNNIVMDARNQLAQLDAAMAQADMPTRIQIEQEKERIRGDVMNILSQYDNELSQGAQGVNPTSVDDRRRTAFGLANAGVAASNPFDFSTETPSQFQNTGPFSSELPIFSRRRQEA